MVSGLHRKKMSLSQNHFMFAFSFVWMIVQNEFLLNKLRDDFEPLPKHLNVTKRLYKPYEKFFTIDPNSEKIARTH